MGRPTNGFWGTFSRLAAQLNAARAYPSARARGHRLRTSYQLVEQSNDFRPGDAGRRTFQQIGESMFDCALRLFAIALAAMCKVELAPLVHKSLKAQRRFGALAVILRALCSALSLSRRPT